MPKSLNKINDIKSGKQRKRKSPKRPSQSRRSLKRFSKRLRRKSRNKYRAGSSANDVETLWKRKQPIISHSYGSESVSGTFSASVINPTTIRVFSRSEPHLWISPADVHVILAYHEDIGTWGHGKDIYWNTDQASSFLYETSQTLEDVLYNTGETHNEVVVQFKENDRTKARIILFTEENILQPNEEENMRVKRKQFFVRYDDAMDLKRELELEEPVLFIELIKGDIIKITDDDIQQAKTRETETDRAFYVNTPKYRDIIYEMKKLTIENPRVQEEFDRVMTGLQVSLQELNDDYIDEFHTRGMERFNPHG